MLINIIDPFVKATNLEWMAEITFGSVIIRILLAVMCGGVLGFERAIKHQAAGLRTYTLVCLGSAIAMMTNQFIFEQFGSGDSARLGAQVISGIGFLGAGTILVTSRNQIKGLTTAAGLWACACLGIAVGAGFYTLAVFAVLAMILVLISLPKIESKILQTSRSFGLHIELETRKNLKDLLVVIRENDLHVDSIERNPAYAESGLSVYSIHLTKEDKKNKKPHSDYLELFGALPYVCHIEETR